MRLIVQIPCLNEAKTIAAVIRDIPRHIDGIDEVKVLVIDDGSSDTTAEVAQRAGADYVERLPSHQGLAKAFMFGLDKCLQLGADVIVHTDGDHQYDGQDIPKLLTPILARQADIVIGDRQVRTLPHFSCLKKFLQCLGSKVVSFLTHTRIPDATSGFRAYSREAALRLNIFSTFTYTLETLIQASRNRLAIVCVPVRTNPPTRASRLYSHMAVYLLRSIATLLHIYVLYRPLRTFCYLGGGIFAIGAGGILRFVWFWLNGYGQGHLQSLIVSAAFLVIGFQVLILGVLANLIAVNRRLNQEILYRLRVQAATGNDATSEPYSLPQRSQETD